MSLFVINRYEGEKKVETENEKKHLSELLKRIEERKQKKLAKNYTKDTKEFKERKKKHKKRKIQSDLVQDISINEDKQNNIESQCVTEDTDQKKLPKKKNRKKQEIKTEENGNASDQGNESSNKLKDPNNAQEQTHKQYKDFIILGTKASRKRQEVKRVLPEWLADPEIIAIDLSSGPSLEEFNSSLDPKMIEVLKTNGIDKLFPVQASMISWLLKCDKDRQQGWWLRDTCVSAPTGSGKTLAYVIPIVHILQCRLVPKIRCLIVVPVHELAAQVHKVMVTYTSHTNLGVALLSGAFSFQQEQTSICKKTLRGEYVSLADIIVATPGRLIDHILKTPGFSLDDLRFLVIDEADRASDWLDYLPEHHRNVPRLTLLNMRNSKMPAQKLLFSATLSQDPEKLNRLGLFKPILFTSVVVRDKDGDVNLDKEVGDFIGRYTSPEELTELAVLCTAEYKPVAVYQMLVRDMFPKTLMFTNSGDTAHRLALLLRSFLSAENVTVGELSALLISKQREDILKKFTNGEIQILVCSDALARGVDVPDVQLVISYDLPKHINGYIHRAGRTGRAGKRGTAISVLTSKQVGIFKNMLTNAHKTVPDIEKLELESIANTLNYPSHLEKLKEDLEREKQNNLRHVKTVKRIKSTIAK